MRCMILLRHWTRAPSACVIVSLTGKKRIPREELGEDAPEAPHVDGCSIGKPQDDLWCPVEPALDVGVDALVRQAAAAKVNHLDDRAVGLTEHDVLRLEVTVHNVEVLQGPGFEGEG